MSSTRRLLILSCSQRKRPDPAPLPALERYDGPAFQVLRKFLRNNSDKTEELDIYVLSAEWGLISSTKPIPVYDRRMTIERAEELRPSILLSIQDLLASTVFHKLFISVGKEYLRSLQGYEDLFPVDTDVIVAAGTQGRKLSELQNWLYDGLLPPQRAPTKPSSGGKAIIRGIEVTLTPQQILDVARSALARDPDGAARYQSWYVEVDKQRIALKWLVSQLTGLPVSTFVSDEARRVLTQLGVEVQRR